MADRAAYDQLVAFLDDERAQGRVHRARLDGDTGALVVEPGSTRHDGEDAVKLRRDASQTRGHPRVRTFVTLRTWSLARLEIKVGARYRPWREALRG